MSSNPQTSSGCGSWALASVTEVMVNRPNDVFVEREGRIERVRDRLFEGKETVVHLMGEQIRETNAASHRPAGRRAPTERPEPIVEHRTDDRGGEWRVGAMVPLADPRD